MSKMYMYKAKEGKVKKLKGLDTILIEFTYLVYVTFYNVIDNLVNDEGPGHASHLCGFNHNSLRP